MRQAVQKVGGAVQRVTDPAAFGFFRAGLSALFTKESKFWPGFGEGVANDGLRPAVSLADEVGRPFAGDGQVFDIAEVAEQLSASLIGCLNHNVDEG